MSTVMSTEKYRKLNPYSNETPNTEHPLYPGNRERHMKWYAVNREKLRREMDEKFSARRTFTDDEIADAAKYGGSI